MAQIMHFNSGVCVVLLPLIAEEESNNQQRECERKSGFVTRLTHRRLKWTVKETIL